jgi:hypothetical protein
LEHPCECGSKPPGSISRELNADIINFSVVLVNELETQSTMELNDFNEIYKDLELVSEEEIKITTETIQSLQECKDLASPEATDGCINALIPIFKLLKDDLVNRLPELYTVAINVLGIAEDNVSQVIEDIETSVDNNNLRIRRELITCVGEM